jgi:hypothetical protein
MVDIALDQCGLALQWVPRPLKTPGCCERAVQSDPNAIEFVPAEVASETMYARWVESQDDGDAFLEQVPSRFRTEAICAAALKLSPYNIFAVPPGRHTSYVVDKFIRSEIGDIYLEDLPVELRTVVLCRAMLERHLVSKADDVPASIWGQLSAVPLQDNE